MAATGAPFRVDGPGRRVWADPRDPAVFGDPYPLYSEVHDACPTFFWEDLGHWCVAGFDDVTALLRDRRLGRQGLVPPRTPANARWWETERYSLLALDPPEHTQMRGLVNRAFLSRQVERLRPRIAEIAGGLIDGFVADGSVDLLPVYAGPLPAIVIAELIGVPVERAGDLLAWSNRMVQMYTFGVDDEVVADADDAAAAFSAFVAEQIDDHRRSPRPDLLTHMLDVEVDGEHLSDTEIIATTILLLNAGHEATVHTTGNAVRTILAGDVDPSELLADDAAVAATVEECLRIEAPLHLFTRYANEEVEIDDGVVLAPGEVVGLLYGAANRDPRRFADPDRFDPSRPDLGHVSFGGGIHHCIGAPLARIELQESLGVLFERLPGLRPAGESRFRDIFHFHGLDRLPLTWDVGPSVR